MRGRLVVGIVLVVAALVTVPADAAKNGVNTSGTLLIDGRPLCGIARPAAGGEPSATHAARAPGALRIASFNILHSQGPDKNLLGQRIPLIVDAAVDADADAIGMQEVVGRFPNATRSPHVAAQIASGLAAAYGESWEWCWFASNPHFPLEPDLRVGDGGFLLSDLMARVNPGNAGFREGVAIVSRLDIVRARTRRLLPRSYEAPFCALPDAITDPLGCPAEAVFDSRQVLWAQIARPGGGTFDLFTTHIAHRLTPVSAYTKQLQVKQILRVIDTWENPRSPTFFVGDFNSVEGGGGEPTDRHATVLAARFIDTFRAFTSAPGNTGGQRIITSNALSTTDDRIDYVFARAACGVSVHDSQVFADVPTQLAADRWLWPSDHHAVVSEVACPT